MLVDCFYRQIVFHNAIAIDRFPARQPGSFEIFVPHLAESVFERSRFLAKIKADPLFERAGCLSRRQRG
jgi:hypothetical protein